MGMVLIVFSLASYFRPLAWAHWLLFGVGTWLVAFGRFQEGPPIPPALQNSVVVGLLLMMFAIIPNYASQPPPSWQEADAA